MLAGELHHLTEEAARALRAVTEIAAYAQEVERRTRTLLCDLDDLSRRAHSQETRLAALVEDNQSLTQRLAHATTQHSTPTPGDETIMSRYSFDTANQRWHLGWDPAVASYYAQAEPVGNRDNNLLRNVVGNDRVGQVPTVGALIAQMPSHVQIPQAVALRLTADAPADPATAAQAASAGIEQANITDAELNELTRMHRATFPLLATAAVTAPAPTTDPYQPTPNPAAATGPRWQREDGFGR